jgi:hypothetical protein
LNQGRELGSELRHAVTLAITVSVTCKHRAQAGRSARMVQPGDTIYAKASGSDRSFTAGI